MEKKKKTCLIIIFIILICLVLSLSGYIVYDKVLSNNNKKTTTTTTKKLENKITTTPSTTTSTTTSTISSENKQSNIKIDKNDLKIDFNEIAFSIESKVNYIDYFYSVPSTYMDTKKIKDIYISNIELDGEKHYLKIKNYNPEDEYDCKKGEDKVLFFDEKIIHEPEGEACYLSSLNEIIVLNKKYLLIHYNEENGGLLIILDKNGNKITNSDDIIVSSIDYISDNAIYFEGWKYNEDCFGTLYKLEIINGKSKISEIDKSNSKLCF